MSVEDIDTGRRKKCEAGEEEGRRRRRRSFTG